MNSNQVKAIAYQHGFELKMQADGTMDLHPYVYHFAQALLRNATQELEKAASDAYALLSAPCGGAQWTKAEKEEIAKALRHALLRL